MRSLRVLGLATLVYAAASLLHFAHNAVLIQDYPNLPTGLTAPGVVAAWLAVTSIGVGGWIAMRRGHVRAGLGALALYAAMGFDGLGHYARAPMAAHTTGMNLTIWIEVVAAALLVGAVCVRLASRAQPTDPSAPCSPRKKIQAS